jgi:hypothetical protein
VFSGQVPGFEGDGIKPEASGIAGSGPNSRGHGFHGQDSGSCLGQGQGKVAGSGKEISHPFMTLDRLDYLMNEGLVEFPVGLEKIVARQDKIKAMIQKGQVDGCPVLLGAHRVVLWTCGYRESAVRQTGAELVKGSGQGTGQQETVIQANQILALHLAKMRKMVANMDLSPIPVSPSPGRSQRPDGRELVRIHMTMQASGQGVAKDVFFELKGF